MQDGVGDRTALRRSIGALPCAADGAVAPRQSAAGVTAHMHRRAGYRREIELRPSWRSQALNALLRLTMGRPLTNESDIVALRRRYERLDARQFGVAADVERMPVECGGVPGEWIVVPRRAPSASCCTCTAGRSRSGFPMRTPRSPPGCAGDCARGRSSPTTGSRRSTRSLRRRDDCHAAYRGLLAQGVDPRNIVLAGDSAGGNLALVTLHRARAAGEPLPACAVLLSPAVDCTLGSPSMVAYDGQDPMIRLASLLVLRRHYVPSPHLYTHPEVSPLFAEFEGLPAAVLPGRQHRTAAGRGDPRRRQGARSRRRRRARTVAGGGARVPDRGLSARGGARRQPHRALRAHAGGLAGHRQLRAARRSSSFP